MLKFLKEGGSVSMMDVGAFKAETLTESPSTPARRWKCISSSPRGDPGSGSGLVGGAGAPDELENSISSSPRGNPGGGGGLVGCAGRLFAFRDELEDLAGIEVEGAGVEVEADVAVEATELLC